jgi:hypothetical protein
METFRKSGIFFAALVRVRRQDPTTGERVEQTVARIKKGENFGVCPPKPWASPGGRGTRTTPPFGKNCGFCYKIDLIFVKLALSAMVLKMFGHGGTAFNVVDAVERLVEAASQSGFQIHVRSAF